jgi:hypothetical protein
VTYRHAGEGRKGLSAMGLPWGQKGHPFGVVLRE